MSLSDDLKSYLIKRQFYQLLRESFKHIFLQVEAEKRRRRKVLLEFRYRLEQ
jgi:hypothetical protein